MAAPSFGETARRLLRIVEAGSSKYKGHADLALTKMACAESRIITNDDLLAQVELELSRPQLEAIIFTAAVCDFDGRVRVGDSLAPNGKNAKRLETSEGQQELALFPARKIAPIIKKTRPDVRLVTFKTTIHQGNEVIIAKARKQMADSGADLVLANDVGNHKNILLSAGAAEEFTERDRALQAIIDRLDD